MMQAYSRLSQLLSQQNMTIPELQKRIEHHGIHVNLKSLYRLSKGHQPLQRLDLRVAGAICQEFEVSLSELIDFKKESNQLANLSIDKQQRLEELMARNNEGSLTDEQYRELQDLVGEAEQVTLHNARLLAKQRIN
jgi:DNA-binding Xre family transcriptional regulator